MQANLNAEKEHAYAAFIDSATQKYTGGRVVFETVTVRYPPKMTLCILGSHVVCMTCVLITATISLIPRISWKVRSRRIARHYLTHEVISCCRKHVATVTRRNSVTNVSEYIPVPGISTQEEAYTLMIPHALEMVNEQ